LEKRKKEKGRTRGWRLAPQLEGKEDDLAETTRAGHALSPFQSLPKARLRRTQPIEKLRPDDH
jgi:hypothetical protein